jgi:hypothetical protein
MEEEQSSLPASATPKLTVKSITEKMAVLDREVRAASACMLRS